MATRVVRRHHRHGADWLQLDADFGPADRGHAGRGSRRQRDLCRQRRRRRISASPIPATPWPAPNADQYALAGILLRRRLRARPARSRPLRRQLRPRHQRRRQLRRQRQRRLQRRRRRRHQLRRRRRRRRPRRRQLRRQRRHPTPTPTPTPTPDARPNSDATRHPTPTPTPTPTPIDTAANRAEPARRDTRPIPRSSRSHRRPRIPKLDQSSEPGSADARSRQLEAGRPLDQFTPALRVDPAWPTGAPAVPGTAPTHRRPSSICQSRIAIDLPPHPGSFGQFLGCGVRVDDLSLLCRFRPNRWQSPMEASRRRRRRRWMPSRWQLGQPKAAIRAAGPSSSSTNLPRAFLPSMRPGAGEERQRCLASPGAMCHLRE